MMKFTHYFEVMRQRPDRAIIELTWINMPLSIRSKKLYSKMVEFGVGQELKKPIASIYGLFCLLTVRQLVGRIRRANPLYLELSLLVGRVVIRQMKNCTHAADYATP